MGNGRFVAVGTGAACCNRRPGCAYLGARPADAPPRSLGCGAKWLRALLSLIHRQEKTKLCSPPLLKWPDMFLPRRHGYLRQTRALAAQWPHSQPLCALLSRSSQLAEGPQQILNPLRLKATPSHAAMREAQTETRRPNIMAMCRRFLPGSACVVHTKVRIPSIDTRSCFHICARAMLTLPHPTPSPSHAL